MLIENGKHLLAEGAGAGAGAGASVGGLSRQSGCVLSCPTYEHSLHLKGQSSLIFVCSPR